MAAAATSAPENDSEVPSLVVAMGDNVVAAVAPRCQNSTPLSKSANRFTLRTSAGVDAGPAGSATEIRSEPSVANTDAGMVATVGRTVGAAGLATTSLVLPESRPSAPGRSIVSGVPADVTARATGATAGVVPAADEAMLITALGNP